MKAFISHRRLVRIFLVDREKCEEVFYRLNTCNEFLALFIHVDKLCRTRYKLLIVQSRFRKEIFKKIECEYKTEIDFQLNVTNFPTREIWIYTRIPRNGELKFITIVFLLLLLLSLFVGIIMISFAGQVLSDTIGNLKKISNQCVIRFICQGRWE